MLKYIEHLIKQTQNAETRLNTTIENLKVQKNYVLSDDYEKLQEVQRYIKKLESEIITAYDLVIIIQKRG